MKTLLAILTLNVLFSGMALADPEQAYKGGKALRDSATGQDNRNVDDRDFEQKMRDRAREAGAKAGGGNKSTTDNKGTNGNKISTENKTAEKTGTPKKTSETAK